MHEASIGQSIVKTVLAEAEKQNAVKVDSVEIEIGELTFLGQDQVEFWIKTGFESTIAEGAEIKFRKIKGRIKCNKCGYEGDITVKEDPQYHLLLPSFTCPECKSSETTIVSGKDAFIRTIKITQEDDEQ
ncbi:MAG: hydrogenase maturation nickel metallochaperone HypA [bacterium]